jgi:hypothetical protein
MPIARTIVDVDGFNPSSDAAYLERLYIPGLRRAGDFRTAGRMFRGEVIVHDGRDGFITQRAKISATELTPRQVADMASR